MNLCQVKGDRMSHQPYETFLFSGDPLDPEQRHSLEAHLRTCEHCNALAVALTGLDRAFSSSPSPQPAPGFTQRWQAHLEAFRQQRQVRNLWLMTLGLFALTSLTVLFIALLNLYHINWAYELSQSIARVSLFAARVRHLILLINSLTHALPISVPMLMLFGTGAVFALCALVITWFSTIIRLYFPINERGNQL